MKIVWNEQSIRWFRDADEFTGYNDRLAALICSHVSAPATLLDIGCGAGLLDLKLAPHFEKITCVDVNREAINAVRSGAAQTGIDNIEALCADAYRLQGSWDTVVAAFCGEETFFDAFFPLAVRELIFITHLNAEGNLGPHGKRVPHGFNSDVARSVLEAKRAKYHFESHTLEYGQPFKSMEAADVFLAAYTESMTKTERAAYLRSNLQTTGDPRFPFYLPKKKTLGLFVIPKNTG